MITDEPEATHAAVRKALAGGELTDTERLDAAARFAANVVGLCFALRDAAGGPTKLVNNLRNSLARQLTLASALIDSVGTAVLRTRTTEFRSSGRVAESAHQMAKRLGWACRTTTPADGWPDKDMLLAGIALERSLAGRAVESSSTSPTPPPANNRGKRLSRVTQRRGNDATLQALVLHHQYDDGAIGNYDPASNRILENDFNLKGNNTLTRFLKAKRIKVGEYRAMCRAKKIGSLIASWLGETRKRSPGLRDED